MVYVRQSSMAQIREHAESALVFRGFVDQVPAAAQAARTARVSCGPWVKMGVARRARKERLVTLAELDWHGERADLDGLALLDREPEDEGIDLVAMLLNAGRRTNPWFQESSDNIIEADELIALDTDVVGCHGYYSEFSRTFHSGPSTPTQEQRTLYRVAYKQTAPAPSGSASPRAGLRQDPTSTDPRRADQPVRTRSLKPLITGLGTGSGIPQDGTLRDALYRLTCGAVAADVVW